MARGGGVERRLRRAQRYTCGQLRGALFMQLSRRAADLPTGILAASRRFGPILIWLLPDLKAGDKPAGSGLRQV
jgi:hypothetical protein